MDLAAAVPVVPNWSMASIPRAIAPEQVRQLLASIDRRTGTGRRDYAIVLLLARLGLRSGEVASLKLDDVDWKAGQLCVHGKSGHRNELPLPTDVGEAIAAYLQVVDRTAPADSSFCARRAPVRGFRGASGIGSIVRHRCSAAASMPPPSARISFAMGWPPRCCAKALRSARSATCWDIAIRRPQ